MEYIQIALDIARVVFCAAVIVIIVRRWKSED